VPILVNEKGEKLSKQTLAAAVDLTAPNVVLFNLLQLLNQNPPPPLQAENAGIIFEMGNWELEFSNEFLNGWFIRFTPTLQLSSYVSIN